MTKKQASSVPLTLSRVAQALGKLALDFGRAVKAVDRRIAGPSLVEVIPAWIENLSGQVLAFKGVDLDALRETGQEQEGADTQEPARRARPARPDPALKRKKERVFVETEVPDWLEKRMPDAKAYIMRPGGCVALAGQSQAHGWHLHLWHTARLPSWAEIRDAMETLIPSTVMMGVMLYPAAWAAIENQPNRLSLYEIKVKPLDLERE